MKLYIQTTDYTCAASSLLMIMNHYKPEFALSQENEFEIWRNSVNLPTRASSIFGLANFAKEMGLNPKIVMGETDYEYPDYRFKGYKKVEIESAKFMSIIYEKKTADLGILVEERNLDIGEIKELILGGNILLLRVNAGIFRETKSTSQYLVVYGFRNGLFLLMDPVKGEVVCEEEKLVEALETLHSKKKRDTRAIIFS